MWRHCLKRSPGLEIHSLKKYYAFHPSFTIIIHLASLSFFIMALNKAMIDPKSRLPIPLPDEMTLCSVDNGRAELVLTIPDVPPSGINSTSGGSGGTSKMKARGSIILTDQRVSSYR